jgi:predicted CXXCH cytochrome family protein
MMRHSRFLMLCLLISGLALLTVTGIAAAQGGPEAEYTGSQGCRTCHRGIYHDFDDTNHALALQAVTDEAVVVADFAAGEAERTLTLPGEDAARPFTLDDVAYIIGAGRYAQRFVVEDADGTLLVLPVEWNALDAAWHGFELGESWPSEAYDFGQQCAYCHTTGFDREALTWLDAGVRCETCHGPGSTHSQLAEEAGIRPTADELTAIRGSVFNQHDSQMCGQCHNRGVAPDGRPYPLDYTPGGDLLDAEVFALVDQTDSVHWWSSGHAAQPNMQYNEWVNSAHAAPPSVIADSEYAEDACLRCHSGDYRYTETVRGWILSGELDGHPPDALTLDTARFGVTCQTCHNPHSQAGHDFNVVAEANALCADCHANDSIEGFIHHPAVEMNEGIALVDVVDGIPSAHFTAEDGPNCMACHMSRLPVSEGPRTSHALLLVLPDAPDELREVAGCTSCHDMLDADETMAFINDVKASTEARLSAAEAALRDDAPAWVGDAIAFVAGDGSGGLHNYTYANALLLAVEGELGLLEPIAVLDADETGPAWVTLPLAGEVEGLTLPGLLGGGAGFLVLLVAGLAMVFRSGWRRLVGALCLLLAVGLIVAAILLLNAPQQVAEASGDDGYCMMCHAGERSYMLADGNLLPLRVDPAAIAASVHGTDSPMGRMGCIDCHGADVFPHETPPTNLRDYRIAKSSLCSDCHSDSLEHYEAVLARNIPVGCADCHGAHAVQPADTLIADGPESPVTLPATIEPTPGPGTFGEPPVVLEEDPLDAPAAEDAE